MVAFAVLLPMGCGGEPGAAPLASRGGALQWEVRGAGRWVPDHPGVGVVSDVMAVDRDIYILDDMSGVVHAFALDGTFLRTLGRAGSGPGEIRRMSGARLAPGPPDSLVVMDYGNGRVHVFPRDVGVPRTIVPDGGVDLESVWIADGVSGFHEVDAGVSGSGFVLRRSEQGAVEDTLVHIAGWAARPLGTQPRPLAPLYPPRVHWTRDAEGTLALGMDRGESVYRLRGTRAAGTFEHGLRARPLTVEDRRALRDAWERRLALGDIPLGFARRIEVSFPEEMPRYAGLLSATGDTLLVQLPSVASDVDPEDLAGGVLAWMGGAEWVVFVGGRLRAGFSLPERVRGIRYADGVLTGLRRAESGDTEFVHYELRGGKP